MDSTTIRAHPDSAGAQKKRGSRVSEGHGEDSVQKYTS